jgi:hypothetical protein
MYEDDKIESMCKPNTQDIHVGGNEAMELQPGRSETVAAVSDGVLPKNHLSRFGGPMW